MALRTDFTFNFEMKYLKQERVYDKRVYWYNTIFIKGLFVLIQV